MNNHDLCLGHIEVAQVSYNNVEYFGIRDIQHFQFQEIE